MKYLLTTFILIFTISINYSQTTPEDEFGAWYMYNGTHKVSNKFDVISGLQLRSFEVLDNINLLFLYTGINYHLNENTTLTLGYSYLDIDRTFLITGETHLYENRPYEQISYKHKLSSLPIYHRLRLEHRRLTFRKERTNFNRFRYRLGTKISLNKTLFLNINNELFANLEGAVFTENRFIATLGINIFENVNFQIGYLNHEINGLNLNRLQVSINIKTNHLKKK
ncbi:MAG: DUF2490 domain-containing protein [Flavobacteriaceae bacterium]|tara:strand:- start:1332 stop:2006 length:675 start_codon:yes stop_codon:yes gene_type:complete